MTDKASYQAIGKKAFDDLVSASERLRKNMDETRATLGGKISDAVENKNLHAKAFGMFLRLNRMDPVKRAELLFHFDIYRERGGFDDDTRLPLPDREAGEDVTGAKPATEEPPAANGKPKKPRAGSFGEKNSDAIADEERDLKERASTRPGLHVVDGAPAGTDPNDTTKH